MCRPASFIIAKDRVFWSRFSDSHEDIISEFDLNADGTHGPNIVRVEITPPNGDMGKPAAEWAFQIDQDILPKWWDAEDGEKRARIALDEWIAANVIREGREERREGRVFLVGNATVKAWGNATVEARGNATVKAWGNATVKAGGNATVKAWGNATVKAGGNATVEAGGNATVEAVGNATVEAGGNATVEAVGNATVEAGGNATVEAWDNATVEAGGNATVEAWDNATVKADSKVTVIRWSKKAAVTLADESVLVDRSGDKPVCYVAGDAIPVEK